MEDELIELLERKNLCFRSFERICREFIDEITRGDIARLGEFQHKRESLINVLEKLELEVGARLRTLGAEYNPPEETRARIARILKEKDGYVRSILDLDLRILGQIDRIKGDTIKTLQSLRVGRQTVSAYRSPMESVESAEGTKILDQEA